LKNAFCSIDIASYFEYSKAKFYVSYVSGISLVFI